MIGYQSQSDWCFSQCCTFVWFFFIYLNSFLNSLTRLCNNWWLTIKDFIFQWIDKFTKHASCAEKTFPPFISSDTWWHIPVKDHTCARAAKHSLVTMQWCDMNDWRALTGRLKTLHNQNPVASWILMAPVSQKKIFYISNICDEKSWYYRYVYC